MSSQKSIGPRVFGSILFAVLFPLGIGLFGGWMVLGALDLELDQPVAVPSASKGQDASQWLGAVYQMDGALKDALLGHRIEDVEAAQKNFQQTGERLQSALESEETASNARTALTGWMAQGDALVKDVMDGNRQGAQTRLNDAAETAREALVAELQNLQSSAPEDIADTPSESVDIVAFAGKEFAPYGLGMLVALLGSVWLSGVVVSRAAQTSRVAVLHDLTRLAEGQTVDEETATVDDGTLRECVIRLSTRQGDTASVIRDHKESLEAASYALVQTATERREASEKHTAMGGTTQESMQALLVSATEVAEVSQRVFTNAESTQHSTAAVTEAFENVAEKLAQFQRLVPLMKELSNHTDLLALNAALEGTKAGKEGRRFAHIAGRMQRVADQFSEHIRALELIAEETLRSVDTGTESVRRASDSVKENTFSARRISLAVQQQREGTEHVLTTIQELVSLTEQETDASHNVVAAAEAVRVLAETLNQAMMGVDQ